jgi:hypothetical protein
MLLIKDSKARHAAMEVIEHFSTLGQAFQNHAALEEMLDADAPVVPERVQAAVQRVLHTIERQGSRELRREVEPLRELLRSFEGLSLAEAIRMVETMTPAQKGDTMSVVHPRNLTPASRDADWELIRKHLSIGREEPKALE